MKHTFVIAAQAGAQEIGHYVLRLDPGLRRDDGGFGLSQCYSCRASLPAGAEIRIFPHYL